MRFAEFATPRPRSVAPYKGGKMEKAKEVDKKTKEERMWAMFCHLSALTMFIIPFGNIIAPLVIWIIKKDEFPLVEDQGKEVLNFQISLTIYLIVSAILTVVVIGIPLLIALGVFGVIVTIIAVIKVNEGEKYRYPLAIRFVN
jgi:uncharacterized Tic20 family protein